MIDYELKSEDLLILEYARDHKVVSIEFVIKLVSTYRAKEVLERLEALKYLKMEGFGKWILTDLGEEALSRAENPGLYGKKLGEK
jgi:hypothetical protein